jgi:hypothetical protein
MVAVSHGYRSKLTEILVPSLSSRRNSRSRITAELERSPLIADAIYRGEGLKR